MNDLRKLFNEEFSYFQCILQFTQNWNSPTHIKEL